MEHSIYINKQIKIQKVGKIPMYAIIVMLVFILAALQDYIYSRLQHTGFYLSESLLYNTFWILFIPFTLFSIRLTKIISPKNKLFRIAYYIGNGFVFTFVHILLFTSLFVSVSNLVFTPPHRFQNIFDAALSNQFYIALLWYSVFPLFQASRHKPFNAAFQYPEKIKLKIGSKIKTVQTSSIQLLTKDKPYSVIITSDQRFLDDKSLKDFEVELNPTIFLRVHRSTIINSTCIKELKSRNNGDYDAKLDNGQVARLSRHYRNNWRQLLR